MESPVLKRLYDYCDALQEKGGEQLEKFLSGLYVVPRYSRESHVSASCDLDRGIVTLNKAPGQPVIKSGSGITEYPMAGRPEIQRDVDKYTGKDLIESIRMAEEDFGEAGEKEKQVLMDLYHELAHEVVFYRNLEGRNHFKEEGTVIFLEKFWTAYNELSGKTEPGKLEKAAMEKAAIYVVRELVNLRGMPKNTPKESKNYANMLRYLQNAMTAQARVESGAKPENLIFSDYMLPGTN
jgi:hypothetical protein